MGTGCARGCKTTGLPAPVKDLGQYANFADVCLFNDRDPVHYIYANREANDGYGRALSPIGITAPMRGVSTICTATSRNCAAIFTRKNS